MKSSTITVLAIICLAFSATRSFAQQAGVQSVVEREIRRQETMQNYAKKAVASGAAAMVAHDYESAFAQYKSAVDVLPSDGSATASLRETAMDGLSRAAVMLARQRISEGRFADATTTVNLVLKENYNPTYGPALALQAKLKSPDTFNKTLTPRFIADVEEVKQLLLDADGFYASGRFDLAFKRYQQVLNIDPYNIAARRGMEKVNGTRQQYADNAYNEARGDMMREIAKGWELPVRRFEVGGSVIIDQPKIDTRGTSLINRKLDEITIPRIDFHEATIREALEFLKQRAAALDTTEQDPSRKGLNIVLKLGPNAPEANSRITLALTDVPLRTALDYVAKAANLKLKVEPYAVAIVPQSEPTEVLITKEYKVPPSFITVLPEPAAGGGLPGAGPGTGVAPASQSAITGRSGAKEFLEASGVNFPEGASAHFLASTSKLIVKNTQANLDLIDVLVETQMTNPPSQVEIEAKFLEITQNNLQELGFDWIVGQFAMPFGSGVYGGGGTPGQGQSINGNSFPLSSTAGGTTLPIGATSPTSGLSTGGLRSGSLAIKANAIDALLFGTPVGPAPAVMAIAGIFTNPQFQVVIRALNQQKGVDLVSAPKVTTKSGQRANIQIIREFRYPSEYDLPQVSASQGAQFQPVVPTTPTSFETKAVGITLEVEPTVGPDGYTIDMILSPRVVDFDGFINYGSPIFANVSGVRGFLDDVVFLGSSQTILATPNIINRPVFSLREVTTEVTVYDGSTVVLGGLLREDVQKVEDKVPIIGDIPLIGRLFRSSVDQHVKRNLIIFVTASLLDPAGQPLMQVDVEDRLVTEPNIPAIKQEAIPGDASTVPLPQ